MSIYDFEIVNIQGEDVSIADYRGKVLLIVNTASKCGFTSQYAGLEELYQQYRAQGLEILGIPCNQFGKQEPGNDSEIQSFCELNYAVSFPMFSKVDVNGGNSHPLYVFLKKHAKGLLGSQKIKWNFTKFLVDSQGNVIDRFAPSTKPEELSEHIELLL